MSKLKSNAEVYAEIIADIASRSAASVEGVELLGKAPADKKPMKDNDVHAYLTADSKVKIDIYLNIVYGYNIPDTVCTVQESIKAAIEKETCYKVSEINVSVISTVFEDEIQTEIVHSFDEADDSDANE